MFCEENNNKYDKYIFKILLDFKKKKKRKDCVDNLLIIKYVVVNVYLKLNCIENWNCIFLVRKCLYMFF